MIKTGIMQPYFFPYLGYWQTMEAVDKYVVFDDVNYIKGGWINRNNILMNDKAFLFTLALSRVSDSKNINEIDILDEKNNFNKVLAHVYNAYLKAPYFRNVFPLIEEIINYPDKNLASYLFNQIKKIAEYLEIETEFILSSQMMKDNNLRSQNRVIDMCQRLSTEQYINAIGGQKLYSREDFKKEGIDLKFIKLLPIEYKQFKNEFVPNLSIIDVMMFNDKKELQKLLKMYELI